MSTALAIAATTAVLKTVLDNGIARANLGGILGQITVSTLPPDRIPVGDNEPSQLNLFLYQVTPNLGWRNLELPSRDGQGERVENPPLAIDLHYLLSAYGKENFHGEILLGHGMQVFHELPVLTRQTIRRVFTPPLSAILERLATAQLADQEELVKLTPETLSSEEISKLWSVFGEKYRPTAAFLATVVLIRASAPTRSAPPVREPAVQVVPLRHPVVREVQPPGVDAGGTTPVTLVGHGLLAPDTAVRFGSGAEAAPDPVSTPDRVRVQLPPGLLAGVNTVQVVQRLRFGRPPTLRPGFESNLVPFVLRPAVARRVVGGVEEPDIHVADVQCTGGVCSAKVTVRLLPSLARRQRVSLLLNEPRAPADRPARAYSFEAPPRQAETTDIVTFAVARVVAGEYLLRVRVDGTDSLLEADAQGRYDRPRVRIA
jgi:hypothetical protein